jgi:hypothetical protein
VILVLHNVCLFKLIFIINFLYFLKFRHILCVIILLNLRVIVILSIFSVLIHVQSLLLFISIFNITVSFINMFSTWFSTVYNCFKINIRILVYLVLFILLRLLNLLLIFKFKILFIGGFNRSIHLILVNLKMGLTNFHFMGSCLFFIKLYI